jgi:hypothetical protein
MLATLAYYGTELIIAEKSFIVHASGLDVMQLFTAVIYKCIPYKKEFLSLESLSTLALFASKAGTFQVFNFWASFLPYPQT